MHHTKPEARPNKDRSQHKTDTNSQSPTFPFTIQEQLPNNRRDQQTKSDTRGIHQNGGEDEAWRVRDSDEEHAMQDHPEKGQTTRWSLPSKTKTTNNRHTWPEAMPCNLHSLQYLLRPDDTKANTKPHLQVANGEQTDSARAEPKQQVRAQQPRPH